MEEASAKYKCGKMEALHVLIIYEDWAHEEGHNSVGDINYPTMANQSAFTIFTLAIEEERIGVKLFLVLI